MKRIAYLAAVLLVTAACLADVVVLRDGHRIEGEVSARGSMLEVKLPHGSVQIEREDVLRIERRATPWQEFEKKLTAVDKSDWKSLGELVTWAQERNLANEALQAEKFHRQALETEYGKQRSTAGSDLARLKALGLWCEKVGLEKEHAAVTSDYWKVRIQSALAKTGQDDPKALVMLALREKEEGAPAQSLRVIYETAILADPGCVAARNALGMQLFEGRWLLKSQVDAILARRHDEKMAASGCVFYEGRWVRPDALALHQKERMLERREIELSSEQARVKAREDELNRDRRELESEKKKMTAEQARLKEEIRDKETANGQLRSDNRLLAQRMDMLSLENRDLRYEIERLHRENRRLRKELDAAKK